MYYVLLASLKRLHLEVLHSLIGQMMAPFSDWLKVTSGYLTTRCLVSDWLRQGLRSLSRDWLTRSPT